MVQVGYVTPHPISTWQLHYDRVTPQHMGKHELERLNVALVAKYWLTIDPPPFELEGLQAKGCVKGRSEMS
jgi:hypothetical protein